MYVHSVWKSTFPWEICKTWLDKKLYGIECCQRYENYEMHNLLQTSWACRYELNIFVTYFPRGSPDIWQLILCQVNDERYCYNKPYICNTPFQWNTIIWLRCFVGIESPKIKHTDLWFWFLKESDQLLITFLIHNSLVKGLALLRY